MSIRGLIIVIILTSIISGLVSACSLKDVPASTLEPDVQITPTSAGVTEPWPIFVPQSDTIINSANATSLSPSSGANFPGSTGFVWLSNNEAALVNQEEVIFVESQQSGIGAQATNKIEIETISSTMPSMLVASIGSEKIAWVSDGTIVNTLQVTSTISQPVTIQAESPITGLALSSSGGKVAYGSFNGQVVIQNLDYSSNSQTFNLPKWLSNYSFSPDSSQLAATDLESFTVFFLNADTGEVLHKLEWLGSATASLYGVYLSPDWRNAAWVSQNVVQIMDIRDGSTGPSLLHPDTVRIVAWSPDGRLLATGSATSIYDDLQPAVIIWDVTNGEILNTLVQQNAVQSIAFSPDGRQLAVLGATGNLQTWSIGR